jgi:hypothetical protein
LKNFFFVFKYEGLIYSTLEKMKITLQLIIFIFFINYHSIAQVLECEESSVEFIEITCIGDETPTTDDDSLSFLIATTNLQGLTIDPLPINFTVQVLEGILGWKTDKNRTAIAFAYLNVPNIVQITASSPGCAPLNLSGLYLRPFNSPTTCESSTLIVPQNLAPIPTLGQWGLIVLGLAVGIFGIAFLRKPFVKKRTV